jgi:hypothetical protein
MIGSDQLFFHLPYHPRGISRRFIQQQHKNICKSTDNLGDSFLRMKNEDTGSTMRIKKLMVAYSRPKNIRDLLTPSKLTEFEDCTVEQYINH